MSCGMLCVMRREIRGVLHLDKYSPPKVICSVGKEERKREKEKRRRKEKKRKRKKKKKDNENEREPAVL